MKQSVIKLRNGDEKRKKNAKAYFSALDVIWIFFKSQLNFQN